MTVVRTVSPGALNRELARCNRTIARATKLAVLEAAMVGAEIIAKDAPVDTGRLKQSVRVRRHGASGHPEVVADAPYAGIVEQGSRPHWVPLSALVRWVWHKKAAFGITDTQGRDRRGRFQGKAGAVPIARAIQRSIARRGTRPQWFMRRNLPRLREVLSTLLRESKGVALAKLGGA